MAGGGGEPEGRAAAAGGGGGPGPCPCPPGGPRGPSPPAEEGETRQRYEELCSSLNMDERARAEAWLSFQSMRRNYTLEVGPRPRGASGAEGCEGSEGPEGPGPGRARPRPSAGSLPVPAATPPPFARQGNDLHWLACALYVACRKAIPTVSRGTVEGNFVSLTRILRCSEQR